MDQFADLLEADLASPRATTLATGSPTEVLALSALARICSAIPSFGNNVVAR